MFGCLYVYMIIYLNNLNFMRILWFTWKDLKHPLAGGAEAMNEGIAKNLVKQGHEVIFLVSGFKNCKDTKNINGYKVIRLGNKYSIYWKAYRFYKKNLVGWADLVIDEMNTIPFFAKYYVKEKNILLAYQLCREIWFYQMFFPLNLIGYLLEPIYLRMLSDCKVLTESESAKTDLQKYGFQRKDINIIPIALNIEPAKNIKNLEKYLEPTLLSLGTIRSMKRTINQLKAFEIAKEKIPDLKFKIAGSLDGRYGKKFIKLIEASKYKKDISYLGRISAEKRLELLKKCHLICVTSIKEGWGLIVTEANSQGTPAIVYDVDGLRDSVRDGETGIVCQKNTPRSLAENIVKLLNDKKKYDLLRKQAWEWSKTFNFDKSCNEFIKALVILEH
jgi:glycosyltransferase involved in cell wall biosynthesis